MTLSSLPVRPAPQNMDEVAGRLEELGRSQDMIFEKLDHIHDAVKEAVNAMLTSYQERVDLGLRVSQLEHQMSLLRSGKKPAKQAPKNRQSTRRRTRDEST
jgi:hypothetical protein